jgi:hypothetical protein
MPSGRGPSHAASRASGLPPPQRAGRGVGSPSAIPDATLTRTTTTSGLPDPDASNGAPILPNQHIPPTHISLSRFYLLSAPPRGYWAGDEGLAYRPYAASSSASSGARAHTPAIPDASAALLRRGVTTSGLPDRTLVVDDGGLTLELASDYEGSESSALDVVTAEEQLEAVEEQERELEQRAAHLIHSEGVGAAAAAATKARGRGEAWVGRYDYARRRSGELSFRRGERLQVVARPSPDWWRARIGDELGLVPAAYLAQADLTPGGGGGAERRAGHNGGGGGAGQQLTLAQLEARARAQGVSPTRLRSALRSRSPRSATLHLIEEAAGMAPSLAAERVGLVSHRAGTSQPGEASSRVRPKSPTNPSALDWDRPTVSFAPRQNRS